MNLKTSDLFVDGRATVEHWQQFTGQKAELFKETK